jgi:hypothetical protein
MTDHRGQRRQLEDGKGHETFGARQKWRNNTMRDWPRSSPSRERECSARKWLERYRMANDTDRRFVSALWQSVRVQGEQVCRNQPSPWSKPWAASIDAVPDLGDAQGGNDSAMQRFGTVKAGEDDEPVGWASLAQANTGSVAASSIRGVLRRDCQVRRRGSTKLRLGGHLEVVAILLCCGQSKADYRAEMRAAMVLTARLPGGEEVAEIAACEVGATWPAPVTTL